jgi:hypothetical protein
MAMIGPTPSCTPNVAQSDIGTRRRFGHPSQGNTGSWNDALAGGMQCISDRPRDYRRGTLLTLRTPDFCTF